MDAALLRCLLCFKSFFPKVWDWKFFSFLSFLLKITYKWFFCFFYSFVLLTHSPCHLSHQNCKLWDTYPYQHYCKICSEWICFFALQTEVKSENSSAKKQCYCYTTASQGLFSWKKLLWKLYSQSHSNWSFCNSVSTTVKMKLLLTQKYRTTIHWHTSYMW